MALLAYYALGAVAVAASARALRRAVDLASFLIFLALPIIFLLPGFLANRTPIPVDHLGAQFAPWNSAAHPAPHNPSLSDVATQFAPWAKAVRMAYKEGSVPFWDRWNGCGMPLAANGQSAPFSPFTVLMLALPLARAFVLLGAMKLFLALCGSYLWLTELGASRAAARFGSVTFAFSFAMTPWLYHPATADICLWPWVFFSMELIRDRAIARRAFGLLVALFTVWTLCGHLETVALGALFGGLWWGLRALRGDIERPAIILGKLCLASPLAAGLSSFSLVPQLKAIAASNRFVLANDPTHLDYVPWVPYRPGWLGGLATSLFPTAFGDLISSPMIPGAAGSIIEMGFGYIGVVGWSVALLIARPGSRRSIKEFVLMTLVIVGLGIAMGLPIFRQVQDALPGLRLVPPLRFLLLVGAGAAGLAALEFDRLLRDAATTKTPLWGFVGACLFVASMALLVSVLLRGQYETAGAVRAQASELLLTLAVLLCGVALSAVLILRRTASLAPFPILLTGLAAIELMYQGTRLYKFYSPADLYPETPLIRYLRSRPTPYRVLSAGGALFPNTNVFAGVESVGTHDPAERRDYVEILDLTAGYPPFDYFKTIRNLNAPIFDFLNVRYLVASAGSRPPGEKWRIVYAGDDGTVLENRDFLPRFFSPARVRRIAPVPGHDARIDALQTFGQPLRDLFANGSLRDDALVLGVGGEASDRTENGSVVVTDIEEGTNWIQFHAAVPEESAHTVLVSSIVNDGGWSARDGEGLGLPVGLANGPFLAIDIRAGARTVTLTYRPPWLHGAILVSLVSLILGALCLLLQRSSAGLRSRGLVSRA